MTIVKAISTQRYEVKILKTDSDAYQVRAKYFDENVLKEHRAKFSEFKTASHYFDCKLRELQGH